MKKLLLTAAALGALSVPALADQAAADKCAAGLDTNGQAIYVAVAPQVTPSTDLRELVTSVTKSLVSGGAVPMGAARGAAEAAGACLAKLR